VHYRQWTRRTSIDTNKSAFYEQVTGVKGSVFVFSFISVLLSLLLCLLRRMLLSTVFLCALC
jgi:hypothetical protein